MLRFRRLTIAIGMVAALVIGGAAAVGITNQRDGAPASSANAQEFVEDGGINVSGTGEVTVVPDVAKVMIGVEARDEDLDVLRNDVDSRMAEVISSLQADGIAEEDIRTTRYDISVERSDSERVVEGRSPSTGTDQPEDELSDNGEPEEFYRVLHLVEVTVEEIDDVGAIIDNALENGANSVGNVRFEVGNPDEAVREARELAVDDARARAEHLAALSGVSAGAPINIRESSPSIPVSRAEMIEEEAMDDAAAGPSIAPGENTITVDVNIIYGIE